MEQIIEKLIGYGVSGIVLAYFLYHDSQDRKAFRDEIKGSRDKLNDHETRIQILESDK